MPTPETLGARDELELEELDPEEEPFVADRSIPKNVKDVDIVDRRRNSRRCCVSFPGWASLPLLCNVILISLLLLQLPDVKDFAFVQSMMHLANSPISAQSNASKTTTSWDTTVASPMATKTPAVSMAMPNLADPADKCRLRKDDFDETSAEKLCKISMVNWTSSIPSSSFRAIRVDDTGGNHAARFGNQLFTAAISVIRALSSNTPLLVLPSDKQLQKLPCVRSSQDVGQMVMRLCAGCNEKQIWCDKSETCNKGKGCPALLQKRIKMFGGGYHQSLGEWGPDDLKYQEELRRFFYSPIPLLDPPLSLPGPNDFVLHYRGYSGDAIFERKTGRILNPPFAFYKWALEHYLQTVPVRGKIWIVTEPRQRRHPTVMRLQKELGAEVYQEMDRLGKEGWLGDFAFVRLASYVAIAPSTFSWWAAFLGDTSTVYFPIPFGRVPLPWCLLLPSDPRYVFYDVWNNESFSNQSAAKARCGELDQEQPIKTVASKLVFGFYPELLETMISRKHLEWVLEHSK